MATLYDLRLTMVEALSEDQRFVHTEVFARASQSADVNAQTDARVIKLGCIQLGHNYENFRRRWAQLNALDHWPEYRLSAIRMTAQVRDHIRLAAQLPTRWVEPV